MAAGRKLQGEIDRTLKKVQEGVELFDEIWEKVPEASPARHPARRLCVSPSNRRLHIPARTHGQRAPARVASRGIRPSTPVPTCPRASQVYNAQNQNQKEKFESELKSQIKKLQRFRDDIKTWITNSDIKDKKPLTDARKLIETEMERFKVCEKEFKTKAFSKEGLSQAPKEDPKERERQKARDWIGSCLEKLGEQVDVYEADLEAIAGKKAKKKDAARFEELIERCRFHEEKLEILLRLIDNESLKPEDLEPVKDQLDFLLEALQDGDDTGIDDESIYEDLSLDDHGGDDDDDHHHHSAPTPTPAPEAPKGKSAMTAKEKKAAEKAAKEEEERKKKES